MTTYELPPEPTDGTRVRDKAGRVWTLSHAGWQSPDHTTTGITWGALMAHFSPLTLIEPEPWPTHELIVATREGKHLTPASGLWAKVREIPRIYRRVTDDHEAHPGDTLTNVVPVRVVPVAELDALRACIKALGYDGIQTRGMPGSLLDTTIRLIEATDALGVAEG